ncbi:MAG: anaerobic sulfatase maturase, partial [Caldilineaceae bacterium]|nr:anaerobic sulfatase maturase [Caldilineaceae bacterium]
HRVPEVAVAWQGGEPTLMGIDFFERSIAYVEKYRKPGMQVMYSIQTNGTLIDDAWAAFFKRHDFLVGISIDGPQAMHDAYRVDKGGQPTFDKVMRGLRVLQAHGVEYNTLTTLHAANVEHPLEVYRFLRDEVGSRYIQFIPIVERDNETGYQEGDTATERSLTARHYGEFLIGVFDDWVQRDVGHIFVQMFDVALAAWLGEQPGLCIFSETCGNALAIEHNGDLFSCDHFVEPKYRLGNIQEIPLLDMVALPQQRQFGLDKRDTLPQYCRDCEVRFACNGGCPKNRFIETPDGEAGLNYLCDGYKLFFHHINQPMRVMA